MTLDEIALACKTDKSSDSHGYTRWYPRYFDPIRDKPLTLLELGWGGDEDPEAGGNSAAMWRDYFPNATVVVIDKHAKTSRPGVNFHQGCQGDSVFLAELHDRYGDFDIVVDDASHVSDLTVRSFEILYPWLKSGGFYAVEDTHSSYHDFFYAQANRNPDLPCPDGSPTAMQFLKRLADEVNYHADWVLFPAEFHKGFRLEFLHFYFNLAVMRKA